jgi:two-component system LytT family response regulator
MRRIRTVIVDDEPLIRERVRDLVNDTDGLELVGEGTNGLEALDLIASLEPDLAFIDVEMPELSGFGVLSELETDKIPGVIFITAYEQYARKAFDVGAIDYLYKPITAERFASAVARARDSLDKTQLRQWQSMISDAASRQFIPAKRKRFVVKHGSSHYFVPVDDIDWIDVADNYLRLHAGKKVHFARGTMRQAEEELDPARFVRIHRSAMIAIDRIASIRGIESGGHVIELKNGAQLRSSRQYAQKVNALLS